METDAGITLSWPLVTCQELGSDVMRECETRQRQNGNEHFTATVPQAIFPVQVSSLLTGSEKLDFQMEAAMCLCIATGELLLCCHGWTVYSGLVADTGVVLHYQRCVVTTV